MQEQEEVKKRCEEGKEKNQEEEKTEKKENHERNPEVSCSRGETRMRTKRGEPGEQDEEEL